MSLNLDYGMWQNEDGGDFGFPDDIMKEAVDSVTNELIADLSPGKRQAIRLGGIPEEWIPRIYERALELCVDDHLDALVNAGLYTRMVDGNGEEWYQLVGDKVPTKEEMDKAIGRYEQLHGSNGT